MSDKCFKRISVRATNILLLSTLSYILIRSENSSCMVRLPNISEMPYFWVIYPPVNMYSFLRGCPGAIGISSSRNFLIIIFMVHGTLNQFFPVAAVIAKSVEPTPVEKTPKAP